MHVLMAHGEKGVEKGLVDALLAAGCRVKTAKTSVEALRLTLEEEFDAIVAQATLADGSGFELLQDVRRLERGWKLGFLLCQEAFPAEVRKRAKRLGAELVHTPFTPNQLVHLLRPDQGVRQSER